jgi:thiamine-phosphate pyrophosphorylase
MKLRGLYAITDANLKGLNLASQVEQAILGGAQIVQYRDKSDDTVRRRHEATEVLRVCRAHQKPLLINDDVHLAADIGADGVHIGKHDMNFARARETLGSQAMIGVSCYNQLALAEDAVALGADYVAFGRFYASSSKPQATQADLQILHNARQRLDCSIVAIGGIHARNGQALLEAGADMLAVIRGVFAADDVQSAARAISRLFL